MNLSAVLNILRELWPHILGSISLLLMVLASAHAVMYKRDSRATIGWVGIIWLVPILGVILYVLLGINRVQRKAVRSRGLRVPNPRRTGGTGETSQLLHQRLPPSCTYLTALDHLVGELTGRDLTHGNTVQPLHNGDEAYPEMLAAIDAAQRSVAMSTYIFDNDRAGKWFIDALIRAVKRGVEVRVIVDDIGARYTWPAVTWPLHAGGVKVERFLPTLVPGLLAYSNLRTHRKLLIADGRLGFTGGLNIREGHMLELHPAHGIRDTHFRLEGPIVRQMQEVFVSDWAFCSGEVLEGEAWFPGLVELGAAPARGISAGPDGDVDKRRLALLGAIACARSSIIIVTPYFLPEDSLINALNVAALRGVTVDIIIPQKNNLSLVQWASTAMLWQLLERKCRVWLSPPPFDHTKLMVVDRVWSLFGSGNWDPRSLRLNFEFDVECYDPRLAESLYASACAKRDAARQTSLKEVDSRGIPVRLRDGVARLLTPYL
jgi:cardiolipin synthase